VKLEVELSESESLGELGCRIERRRGWRWIELTFEYQETATKLSGSFEAELEGPLGGW
jgi:hypothetical protein